MTMPIPKPRKSEKQGDFVGRCHTALADEYTNQAQRHAICMGAWRDRNKRNEGGNDVNEKRYSIMEVQLAGTGARRMHGGIEYAVYPVVMLVEGVHHGAIGDPVLYNQDVLKASAEHWNRMPVTIHHPQDGDQFVLCNDPTRPEIATQWSVGWIENATFDAGKLKAEAWVNIRLAEERCPGIIQRLDLGDKMEVSTGLMAMEEPNAGRWNEEDYAAIVQQIDPDHLALLPDTVGACSWQDGCGVRINQARVKEFDGKFYPVPCINRTGKSSYGDVMHLVSNYVDGMDERNDDGEFTKVHFVDEVYDGYFIYTERVRGRDPEAVTYKQAYSVDAENKLMVEGERTQVRKDVRYLPVTEQNSGATKDGSAAKHNSKEDVHMSKDTKCCPQKIERLLTNENSAFTADDREWLEAQEEAVVDKLLAQVNTAADTKKELETTQQEVAKLKANAYKPPTTVEEALALQPEPIRVILEAGLREHDAKKENLVKAIMKNDRCTYTEKQLQAKQVAELEMLANLAAPANSRVGVHTGRTYTPEFQQEDEVKPYEAPQLNLGSKGGNA